MKFNVEDLIEKGLVKKKTYTEGVYKGLCVLKYSRKVFFDNLWSLDERLLECRGAVVDEEDNIIARPFKKVFNYLENNCCEELSLETPVEVPVKFNGFLAAVTLTEKYGLIVSTTGTLDSDYAQLARKWVESSECNFREGKTYLFEVCDSSDPHIVKEEEGIYLIGIRDIATGNLLDEVDVRLMARCWNVKHSPKNITTFGNVLNDLQDVKHEGFMVRCAESGEVLCKLKSPHYLSKKMLQRCSKAKANLMYKDPKSFKQRLDEEFFGAFDKILETFTQEEYLNMQEQDRRKWIEDYFKGEDK